MINATKGGKGKGRGQEVKDVYLQIEKEGTAVKFLSPGSYTDEDLIREAQDNKVYRPYCKSLGIV